MSAPIGLMVVYEVELDFSNLLTDGYPWTGAGWSNTTGSMVLNTYYLPALRVGDSLAAVQDKRVFYYVMLKDPARDRSALDPTRNGPIPDRHIPTNEELYGTPTIPEVGADTTATPTDDGVPEDSSTDEEEIPSLPGIPELSDVSVYIPSPQVRKLFINGVSQNLVDDIYFPTPTLPADLIIGNSAADINVDEFRICTIGKYVDNFTPSSEAYDIVEYQVDITENLTTTTDKELIAGLQSVDFTTYFMSLDAVNFMFEGVFYEVVDTVPQLTGSATVSAYELGSADEAKVNNSNMAYDEVDVYINELIVDEVLENIEQDDEIFYSVNEDDADANAESASTDSVDYAASSETVDVSEEMTFSTLVIMAYGERVDTLISSEPTTSMPDYTIDVFIDEILTARCTATRYITLAGMAQELLNFAEQLAFSHGVSLLEALALGTTLSVNWNGTRTVIDTAFIAESIKLQFIHAITEALELTDNTSVMLSLLISEFVELSEIIIANRNSVNILTESISTTDLVPIFSFNITASDQLALQESFISILGLSVEDAINVVETIVTNVNTIKILNDIIHFTGTLPFLGFNITTSDQLALQESLVSILGLSVEDAINIVETISSICNISNILIDNLSVRDAAPLIALVLALSESVAFTDTTADGILLLQNATSSLQITDTITNALGIAVLEYLGFTELVNAIATMTEAINDSSTLTDSIIPGYVNTISELLTTIDTASVIPLLVGIIIESFALSEVLSGQLRVLEETTESLVLIDTVSSIGTLYNTVTDSIHTDIIIELDGEIWECYVLNTPKFMPSIYSGFNFNSYAMFDNRAYGCKSDGIYELIGDTDNGTKISTGLRLSATSFNVPNNKRFRKAYIGVSGAKPVFITETETGATKVYSIDTQGEVDTSRALKSKKWTLSVANFDTLDFVKLIPVVLAK